ncbi:MAG: branched-chain amino acid ABC transporter substrate-binding protein, partial [Elusimicrobiota bacterium]
MRGLLLSAVVLLSGCFQDSPRVTRLLVAAPMSGALASEGRGLERAVRMAVDEEAAEGSTPTVEVVVMDDKGDPAAAADVARRAVEDGSIFAVIGPMTSGCAIEASRVFALAPLAMITPSATAPILTLQQERPDWTGDRVVFRLPPSDLMQGDVAAEYAVKRLSLRRFVLVSDGTPYGEGLCNAFHHALKRKGGKTLDLLTIKPGLKDYGPAVDAVMTARPEGLFFGGLTLEAGRLIRQARAAGFEGTFMSGDGAKNPEFFEIAGAAGDGAYLTVVGVPIDSLPSAADFLERYQKRWSSEPRPFDHFGYEAA